MNGNRGGQHGFTLLELLVVLSIIVLATAVVLPNITGTESNLLTAQVRQTAAAFNYARRLAIVEGAPQQANLFQMEVDSPEYGETRIALLEKSRIPLIENPNVRMTYQADINADPESFETLSIEFFPQGGSTGGILHFTLEELSASIRVDPITGRILTLYPGEEFEEDFN